MDFFNVHPGMKLVLDPINFFDSMEIDDDGLRDIMRPPYLQFKFCSQDGPNPSNCSLYKMKTSITRLIELAEAKSPNCSHIKVGGPIFCILKFHSWK